MYGRNWAVISKAVPFNSSFIFYAQSPKTTGDSVLVNTYPSILALLKCLLPTLTHTHTHTYKPPPAVIQCVYLTLVWLKSDQIAFLIVELKHPGYSIDSRITPACIRSSGSDRILLSAQARDFFPGGVSQKYTDGATARKSAIVHLVSVIIMYTIYEAYKDVASSRSSYAIFLDCRGSWWCNEVSRR